MPCDGGPRRTSRPVGLSLGSTAGIRINLFFVAVRRPEWRVSWLSSEDGKLFFRITLPACDKRSQSKSSFFFFSQLEGFILHHLGSSI